VKIFDDIGQDGAMVFLVMCFGRLLGASILIWSIGALGRKTSIIAAFISQTVAFAGLIAMDLTESYDFLYPICALYMLSCAIHSGIAGPLMVETIPSVGIGIALGIGWFLEGCIGLFGPIMTEMWPGPTGTMMFFTFWSTAGIFALDYFIIETKGKQTDEIEQEYIHFKYSPFRLCPKKVVG
jgi:hypothetical protein